MLTLGDTPQLFPPGERFSYNNAGYCVLGRLVEVLRGKPFDDCVRERLFEPLGLTHAANGPYEAILFRAAVGHVRPDSGCRARAGTGLGAGTLECAGRLDARDAPSRPAGLRADAHERGPGSGRHGVLSPEAVRLMYTPHVQLPALGLMGDAWGLGPELFQNPAGLLAGHDGNTIGQAAFLRFVPDKGVALALLTNGGDTFALYRDIASHVLGELAGVTLPPLPSPPAAPERIDASRYRGHLLHADPGHDREPGRRRAHLARPGPQGHHGRDGRSQPERNELVHYEGDSLIPVKADRGMYLPHAFVGDDGQGRAQYLHVGRAIRRVERHRPSRPAPAAGLRPRARRSAIGPGVEPSPPLMTAVRDGRRSRRRRSSCQPGPLARVARTPGSASWPDASGACWSRCGCSSRRRS